MIDLSKVRMLEYTINLDITDLDVLRLATRGTIASMYFKESRILLDIFHRSYTTKANFYIGNIHEDDDRIFFHFLASLSNGVVIEKAFWNYSIIPLMTLEAMESWKRPRKISITLKVGLYEGHGLVQDWQNVLSKIDDFIPVCFQPSPYTRMMDELLNSCRFTDVKISCLDGRELSVHKCLLTAASPYFRATFSENFKNSNAIIKVEFNYPIVKEVISYIYTGRLKEEMIENWPDVYRMACYFHLDILANHSELQMIVHTPSDMDGMKNVLKFAMKFHALRLKSFIIERIRIIQKTQDCSHYHCGHYFCIEY